MLINLINALEVKKHSATRYLKFKHGRRPNYPPTPPSKIHASTRADAHIVNSRYTVTRVPRVSTRILDGVCAPARRTRTQTPVRPIAFVVISIA